ncbi:hypothetical protein GCM10009097_42340 [Pigmentiphaga daeguensis]|uniref:PAAR motif-containing protein n=1 Tax=Pigmentiphaga daeguensis TaxID=414049 RepID=A0ABP3MHC2_9BURK
MPPTIQAIIIAAGEPACIATSDGALKMPAPMTMPTTSAMMSSVPRSGRVGGLAAASGLDACGVDAGNALLMTGGSSVQGRDA